MKRIAILTAGGDTPALNATIAGAVTRANSLQIRVFGIIKGFSGMLNPRFPHLELNPLFHAIPELNPCYGGTILGASRTYIDSKDKQALDAVAHRLKSLQIDGLICIGGDGTINGMQPLADYLPVVLAPKTIDNDLGLNYPEEANDWIRETDPATGKFKYRKLDSRPDIELDEIVNYATPGYATAVYVAASGIERIRTTAESHRRIAIIEVMGRDSGYIALGSAYGQPDMILVPESPIDFDRIEQRVREIYERQKNVVLVVGEGVVTADGRLLGDDAKQFDPSGKPVLSGAAEVIRNELCQRLGDKYFTSKRRNEGASSAIFTRKLGHTQRGGRPIHFDRFQAMQLGARRLNCCTRGLPITSPPCSGPSHAGFSSMRSPPTSCATSGGDPSPPDAQISLRRRPVQTVGLWREVSRSDLHQRDRPRRYGGGAGQPVPPGKPEALVPERQHRHPEKDSNARRLRSCGAVEADGLCSAFRRGTVPEDLNRSIPRLLGERPDHQVEQTIVIKVDRFEGGMVGPPVLQCLPGKLPGSGLLEPDHRIKRESLLSPCQASGQQGTCGNVEVAIIVEVSRNRAVNSGQIGQVMLAEGKLPLVFQPEHTVKWLEVEAVKRVAVCAQHVKIPIPIEIHQLDSAGTPGWFVSREDAFTAKLPGPIIQKSLDNLVLLADEGDEIEVAVTIPIGRGDMNGSVPGIDLFQFKPRFAATPQVAQQQNSPGFLPTKFSHDQVKVAIAVEVTRFDVGDPSNPGLQFAGFERQGARPPHPDDATSELV